MRALIHMVPARKTRPNNNPSTLDWLGGLGGWWWVGGRWLVLGSGPGCCDFYFYFPTGSEKKQSVYVGEKKGLRLFVYHFSEEGGEDTIFTHARGGGSY